MHKTHCQILAVCIFILAAIKPEGVHASVVSDSTDFISKEIVVVASPDYDISGISEEILGKHWRDLWSTPFKAGVIDLSKFAGGLTAYKKGGGLQTKSLHFKGEDGKKYKFRSMDKDPRSVLPEDLRNTIFADAFKDQISASHPYSSIIVSALLDEVDILNSKPVVVVLPDDVRLGEFRKSFKGILGTIEENPDDGKDGKKGFGDADKIVDTYDLYEKVEKDNDNRVDAVEFLKARLVDLMVGDWDRHYDQWLWAGYKKDGVMSYKPIPRDRDQAFSLYDGLLPMLAGRAITQIEGYSKDYPPIYDLSFNGRYLDRRFLPAVEKYVYDSLADLIRGKLTDSVIINAVRLMPKEWHAFGVRKLSGYIIARRDKLNEAAEEYYELINEIADIYCSNKNEEVRITCKDGLMNIEVYKIRKDGMTSQAPLFSRNFDPDVTDEVRIYLDKGNDKVTLNGGEINGGEDFSYFPLDVKLIYGEGRKDISDRNPGFLDIVKDLRSLTDPKERFEPSTEDRSYDWRFKPVLAYNSDDGLVIGGGPILYHYDYGVKPYDYKLTMTAAYVTASKSVQFEFLSEYFSIIKGVKISPEFIFTQLGIRKFFGFGNETPYDKQKERDGYYNVDQNFTVFRVGFEKILSNKFTFELTPFIGSNLTYDNPEGNLGNYPGIYGLGRLNHMGINGKLTFDSRNNRTYPQRGFYVNVLFNLTPALMEGNYGFGKAGIDFRAYYCRDTTKGMALAFRGGIGKVWGTFPFYESMFLGGVNSLKGYNRERFAGDLVVLSQAEWRIPVTVINILVPGVLGVSAFGGVGRVFVENDDSRKWHPSVGGSLWMSYLNRMYNFELSVGRSYEGFTVSLGSAFFL